MRQKVSSNFQYGKANANPGQIHLEMKCPMLNFDNEKSMLLRIQSASLRDEGDELRREILADTTPVPVFGNYQVSQIVSIALNPSSNEFPTKKSSRRLVHLADLGLSTDYYQRGLNSMSEDQAKKVLDQCVKYFENNSYKWFDTAAMALKIGFDASFYKKDGTTMRACHTDLFPWATRAFSTLDKTLQQKFKRENQAFLQWFLSREIVTNIVILGGSTWKELNTDFEFKSNLRERPKIEDAPVFEYGNVMLGNVPKRYFYSSKGPSARGSDAYKKEFHEAFGEFIAQVQGKATA
jgi:hypothetical protein